MSQVIDAAYHVVHDYPGGAASLAPRLHKSPTSLSHEVNGTGQAKMGLETAVAVSILAKDYRILDAFAAQCGRMTLPLPEALQAGGPGMLACQGAFLREVADVVTELGNTLADGEVSQNERDAVRQQAGELVAALQALVVEVERAHELGKARRAERVAQAAVAPRGRA